MKKLLILSLIISSIGFSKTLKYKPLFDESVVVNTNFIKLRDVPQVERKVLSEFDKTNTTESVIMSYLNGTKSVDGYTNVKGNVRVTSSLYTYDSIKNNFRLNDVNSVTKLIFEDSVSFSKNATINLRTNISKGISDSLIFKNIVVGDYITLNVINEGNIPRYNKVFLGMFSTNISINLANRIFVSDVEYVLERIKQGNKFLYYLEPKFKNIESLEYYKSKELTYNDNTKNISKNETLREVIQVITTNVNTISRSVIDVEN